MTRRLGVPVNAFEMKHRGGAHQPEIDAQRGRARRLDLKADSSSKAHHVPPRDEARKMGHPIMSSGRRTGDKPVVGCRRWVPTSRASAHTLTPTSTMALPQGARRAA